MIYSDKMFQDECNDLLLMTAQNYSKSTKMRNKLLLKINQALLINQSNRLILFVRTKS